MSIKSFDKQNLKTMRQEIDAALNTVAEKYGMKLSLGNIRYTTDTFNAKLTGAIGTAAATQDDSSTSELKWRTAFLRNYFYFGLEKSDLDKEVTLRGGRKFIIAGARPKARDPIVLKEVGQDKYIAATALEVKTALGK